MKQKRGEEKQRLVGRVHAVDVVISGEGRGVIPLRGRGSDRAWLPPIQPRCTRLRRGVWRPWRFIELDGVVVALEPDLGRPLRDNVVWYIFS
jgi:hypothetical protein